MGEYFEDYKVSKSLEENDINITFIQRDRTFFK